MKNTEIEAEKIGILATDDAKVTVKKLIVKADEPKTLWDLDSDVLQDELARCFYKRSELNKKFVLPLLLIVLSVGVLFISLNFKHVIGSDFIFLVVIFGLGFPAIWFANIEKEVKPSLSFYKERIGYIKLILQDRR